MLNKNLSGILRAIISLSFLCLGSCASIDKIRLPPDNGFSVANLMSIQGESLKLSRDRYFVAFNLENLHQRRIAIPVHFIECFSGHEQGVISFSTRKIMSNGMYTFPLSINAAADYSIRLKPGRNKNFKLGCVFPQGRPQGAISMRIKKILDDEFVNADGMRVLLASDLDWLILDSKSKSAESAEMVAFSDGR